MGRPYAARPVRRRMYGFGYAYDTEASEKLRQPKNRPHHHAVPIEKLKRLPELLESPLALVRQGDTIISVLKEKDEKGNTLIVPIEQKGHACYQDAYIESNFIKSMYGKRNIEKFLNQAAREGKILYLEEEKSASCGIVIRETNTKIGADIGKLPLQLRQFQEANSFENSIAQEEQKVNVFSEKSQEAHIANVQPPRL